MAFGFTTQFRRPRGARHLVRRLRLIALLREGLNRRAVVITAAAGAGKTSLLLDLVSDLNRPICWLTLDDWHTDPVELLGALARSAEVLAPDLPAAVEQALASGAGEAAAQRQALIALLDALARQPRGVFVLDDLHRVSGSVQASAVIDTLLAYLPPGWCLVLSGRREPEFPQIPRLALEDELGRVSQEQLALTCDETGAVLTSLYRRPVAEAQAERMWRSTGGWAAGVVLRAQAHRVVVPDEDDESLLEQARQGAVGDADLFGYLGCAILDGIDPCERNVLLRAAVPRTLDRRTYAAALEFEPDAGLPVTLLAEALHTPASLAARHAFITPDTRGADGSPRFRMHDLFRDFLLAQADDAAPDVVRRLHQAIGRVCEEREDAAETLYHYRQATDWPSLVRITRGILARYRGQGRWRSMRELIDSLPDEALRSDIDLSIDRAEAHCNLGYPEQTLAELALLWPRLAGVETRVPRARALVVRGTALRVSGAHAAAVADCREGERLLLEADAPASLCAHAQRLLGIALGASGDFAEALTVLKQALKVFERQGVVGERSSTHDAIAAALLQLGRAGEAATHLERARQGWSSLRNANSLSLTLNNLGVAYTSLGDLDNAEVVLVEAQRKAEKSDNQRIAVGALLARADVARERGDGSTMAELSSEALRRARRYEDPYHVQYALQTLAEAHRLLGDVNRAETLAREATGIAAEQAGRFEQGLAERTLGQVLTDRGDLVAAVERLRRAVVLLGDCDAGRELVQGRLALAEALLQAGEEREATALGLEAAHLARRLGLDSLLRRLTRQHVALIDRMIARYPKADELRGLGEHRDTAPRAEDVSEPAITSALPSVRAYMLGRIHVQVNGKEVTDGWESGKARELLLFMLANPGITTTAELVDALWPTASEDQGLRSLHTTVYRLRQAVYHECIVSSRRGYKLNPHGVFWFDVNEFRRLSQTPRDLAEEGQRQQLERAAALYAGPVAATLLGEWADELRQECEERYLRTLSDLAGYYLQRRLFVRATETAERTLEIDPFNETVARVLFEARLQSGDMAGAMRAFRRFRDDLVREGLTPSLAFAGRYDEITTGDFSVVAL